MRRSCAIIALLCLAACRPWYGDSTNPFITPMPSPPPGSGFAHRLAGVPIIYIVNDMPQTYLRAITPMYGYQGCWAYAKPPNNVINQKSSHLVPPPAPGMFAPIRTDCVRAVMKSYFLPDSELTCTVTITGMTATLTNGIDSLCRLIHNTDGSYTLHYLSASHAHTFPPLAHFTRWSYAVMRRLFNEVTLLN